MNKIAQASLTIEEIVRQEHLQEISKLHSQLTTLKSETVKCLTIVQIADVTGGAELKGVIVNLESQLQFEHTTCETDKWWYKGIIGEMTKRHQDSSLQCSMIKQRLSEKNAQV